MPTTATRSTRRRLSLGAAALAALTGLTVAAAPASGTEAKPGNGKAVQAGLDGLVREHGFPAAMASVREANGRSRFYSAGVGDLATGRPVPVESRVRIASASKMFTATVVLQLVGEGKVGLDEPVEKYLPGLLRGEGIDGNDITVRHLLQHTSGLPDYDDVLIGEDYFPVQHQHFEPMELIDATLTRPALFAPGEGWSYSNANYVLAGLVVQQVTGRPISEEITNRIIEKLRLRDTYWPEFDEQTIRGRHAHGYWPDADGKPVDVTEQDTSMGWAAGQLISTPRDVNTFLTALLGGELLAPEVLAQMKDTIETPDFDTTGTARYGTFALSCGGVAWNHGGNAPGHVSRNGITDDGRVVTLAVNEVPTTLAAAEHIEDAVDRILCS